MEPIIDLNNEIMIFNYQDVKKEKSKELILSSHHNLCVIFPTNKVINEILISYTDQRSICKLTIDVKRNIFKQIELDSVRMNITINSITCTNHEHLLMWFYQFEKYKHPIMENIYYLLSMLCTQSSFFYSFEILHHTYLLPEFEFHIVPTTDQPTININSNSVSIDIIFKKMFQYTNIATGQVLTKFHTFTVFTINLTEDKNGILEFAMLYIVKENNLLIL